MDSIETAMYRSLKKSDGIVMVVSLPYDFAHSAAYIFVIPQAPRLDIEGFDAEFGVKTSEELWKLSRNNRG